MKKPSKVIENQLQKGKPLSSFAIDSLRNAGQEDALKANAHNVVLAMLEGKPIRQSDYEEAVAYFPDKANEWLASGGRVKEEKTIAEWTSIYQIAKELNVSEQSIHQMMKRNPTVAPRPNSQGKFNRNEVKEFYANRSYNTSRGQRDYKQKILEQEYRLKKCKADEAEGLVIPKALVVDLYKDTDIYLEASYKRIAKMLSGYKVKNIKLTEAEIYEEILKIIKPEFKRWREFLQGIDG